MQYGHFDNARREYVIDRIDLPVSWTNYIGIGDMYGVFNHTAGGYLLYQSPEYHRISRFRPNGVPMDGPGHYVYIRDNDTGDYWTVSWQPVGKDKAKYSCRHGLSYVKYLCDYSKIHAEQTLMVAMDDPVELWNVTLRNDSGRPRDLSVFSYVEFSFHQIDMDNRNFQMSLYAAGSRYRDGVIEYELHYEEDGYQFFTGSFEPDGFECLRDAFIGPYRTERDPQTVETGDCRGSFEDGGNHCGCLKKNITLRPGEDARLIFMLGEGGAQAGRADAGKYSAVAEKVKAVCESTLWDGEWYIRGITADNRRIGTHNDAEGRVHMESNTWAVLSGAASHARGVKAMDSVDEYLYTEYGLMLNAPCYTKPDDGIGFVTRVYPGLKENGAIFSHPNPWAWCAEAMLGRGSRAIKFYNALCPALQNDKIEIRQSEPYSYCQFVVGKAHPAFGRARHPFMTGSSGWAYYAATQYILGIRPDFDGLCVDPCIPSDWKKFHVTRKWRGAVYNIHVLNPDGVEKGVKQILADGKPVDRLPVLPAGSVCTAEIIMG